MDPERLTCRTSGKIIPTFTLNYGLRFDRFHRLYERASQASPRINMVWQALPGYHGACGFYFALHFTRQPFELVGSKDVALFSEHDLAGGVVSSRFIPLPGARETTTTPRRFNKRSPANSRLESILITSSQKI